MPVVLTIDKVSRFDNCLLHGRLFLNMDVAIFDDFADLRFAQSKMFGGCQVHLTVIDLTRFNKTNIQGKGPDGKWTRKPLAYRESNIFNLCVIRPPEICVNLVFKQIHTANSYTT